MNSTLGSSLPSNAIPFIGSYFNITDQNQLILPISIYLCGYVLGPLAFGPLSEQYGRKVIMTSTFAGFSIFMLGSAVAPNFAGFLVFRLLGGVCASSPITVVGGIYADLYSDPVTRGRAMALYMVVTPPFFSECFADNKIGSNLLWSFVSSGKKKFLLQIVHNLAKFCISLFFSSSDNFERSAVINHFNDSIAINTDCLTTWSSFELRGLN